MATQEEKKYGRTPLEFPYDTHHLSAFFLEHIWDQQPALYEHRDTNSAPTCKRSLYMFCEQYNVSRLVSYRSVSKEASYLTTRLIILSRRYASTDGFSVRREQDSVTLACLL
jgi:hypothetical protein